MNLFEEKTHSSKSDKNRFMVEQLRYEQSIFLFKIVSVFAFLAFSLNFH